MKKLILIAMMAFATTANAAEGWVTTMCPQLGTLTMNLYDLAHASYNQYDYENGPYGVAAYVRGVDNLDVRSSVKETLRNLIITESKIVWEYRNDFSRVEMGLMMEQACEKARAE